MRQFLLVIMVFLPVYLAAQNRVITGVVTDSLGIALESASIMASPTEKDRALKFSIADETGRYRLVLEKNSSYTVSVSYIGFFDQSFLVTPEDEIDAFNFRLKKSNEVLKEIVIKYDVKPLVIKKDTMTYNVQSFTNGSERKLKDQLKKLPGVEVDRDGNVTLQGKRVTTFLVENREFFGGGTKLGVENIPADAVDKIEFIDHFNEVAFLKEVSGSQQLAINIKLKEDKKEFLFGDIEAASGIPEYYKMHTGLFYYGGTTTLGFIGDVNNVGDRALDFADISRFDGGSSFIENNSPIEDLFGFAIDNKEVVRNKSKFSASNFSHRFNEKLEVLGYAVFSMVENEMENQSEINYFQNENTTFENRLTNISTDNSFFLGRLKLKNKVSKSEQWIYNANFKLVGKNVTDNLSSQTSLQTINFRTLSDLDHFSFKHFFEWHKSYSNNKTATFVASHNYDKKNVGNDWLANTPFLTGLIPWSDAENYNVQQVLNLNTNTFDVLFKNYWILNNFNHVYFVAGTTFTDANYSSDEQQVFDGEPSNSFSNNGFGNNLDHKFNDLRAGTEYKFLLKKWINKASLYYHHYSLRNSNLSIENKFDKGYFEPQFRSEYEFNKGETVVFNYKLSNEFSEYNKYAECFTVLNYNAVSEGNQALVGERFNSYSLYYKKISLLYGFSANAGLNYDRKSNAIRNEVVLQGINQLTTLVQTNNSEENLFFRGTVSKDIYKLNLGINCLLSNMNYFQLVNGLENKVNRSSNNFGIVLKTKDVNWPFITIRYNKSFDEFKSLSVATFNSDKFSLDYDVVLNEQFVFKAFYEYQRNQSSNSRAASFNTANISCGYQPTKSAWKFEVSARNIFNNSIRNTNSFSDFLSMNQTVAVLPRIVMLDVTYKL